MKKIIFYSIIIFITSIYSNLAQVKKYGKVTVEELTNKSDDKFKDANAIVLFKKRESYYEYDGERGFSLITKVHERIKLYNKDGFDAATKKIKYYTQKNIEEEKLTIKANTYNLEGKKVIKTKLSNKDIFKKSENEFWSSKSFTMPNLKAGTIIEIEYKIISPFFWKIDDVIFQYNIPTKYFEAKIHIPEYYIFKTTVSKYYPVNIKSSTKNKSIDYVYRENNRNDGIKSVYSKRETHRKNLEYIENINEIKLTNIKALEDEPYVNNINNYRGKITFELMKTRFPTSGEKYYSSNWDDVTKRIYENPNFGSELRKTNYFKNDLNEILKGKTSRYEKILAVFNFVKSKVKWNKHHSIYANNGVKYAYKDGVGNVAEINLILVAMLRESGMNVNPILVSTRSNGVPLFPTRDGFNYVIAGVELQNDLMLLDATEEFSMPNILPKRVLNWQGRIIRKNGSSAFIDLFPKVYNIEMNRLNTKIDTEGTIKGSLRSSYKNLNALTLRKVLNNLTEEALIESLEYRYKPIEIGKTRLSNKTDLEKPFTISLQFSAENQVEIINNKMYFSPLFFLQENENAFKLDERTLPVDFASAWLDKYEIVIQIPEGYKIEKLPESNTIESESGTANFSYSISLKDNKILLVVTTKINVPIIPYTQYKELKDFYTARILKQNEKIVLVKE